MPDNGHDRLDRIEAILEEAGKHLRAVDERLDRISARHEALAQSVELIARMQRENEARQAKNEALLGQVIEAIHGLTRIVESHEQRLDDLEERE